MSGLSKTEIPSLGSYLLQQEHTSKSFLNSSINWGSNIQINHNSHQGQIYAGLSQGENSQITLHAHEEDWLVAWNKVHLHAVTCSQLRLWPLQLQCSLFISPTSDSSTWLTTWPHSWYRKHRPRVWLSSWLPTLQWSWVGFLTESVTKYLKRIRLLVIDLGARRSWMSFPNCSSYHYLWNTGEYSGRTRLEMLQMLPPRDWLKKQ